MNINCAWHRESHSREHVFEHTFHLNKGSDFSLFVTTAEKKVDQAKRFFQVNPQNGQKKLVRIYKKNKKGVELFNWQEKGKMLICKLTTKGNNLELRKNVLSLSWESWLFPVNFL